MISLFCDKLLYSPLEFPSFINKLKNKHKIRVIKNINQANIILSSYLNILKKYESKFGKTKKYLLWTHEPYHNYSLKSKIGLIEIMNCYTQDVFTHNFRYFYFKSPLPINLNNSYQRLGDCVVLSTFYDFKYYEKNPKTILPIRYQLIESGYKKGFLKVHGKNWNNHSFIESEGNSRNQGDRRKSKAEILGKYRFNLCIENALAPYYVTEKIWEPIKYGCLPIYFSNSTIYEIFPRDSFVDVRNYYDDQNEVLNYR